MPAAGKTRPSRPQQRRHARAHALPAVAIPRHRYSKFATAPARCGSPPPPLVGPPSPSPKSERYTQCSSGIGENHVSRPRSEGAAGARPGEQRLRGGVRGGRLRWHFGGGTKRAVKAEKPEEASGAAAAAAALRAAVGFRPRATREILTAHPAASGPLGCLTRRVRSDTMYIHSPTPTGRNVRDGVLRKRRGHSLVCGAWARGGEQEESQLPGRPQARRARGCALSPPGRRGRSASWRPRAAPSPPPARPAPPSPRRRAATAARAAAAPAVDAGPPPPPTPPKSPGEPPSESGLPSCRRRRGWRRGGSAGGRTEWRHCASAGVHVWQAGGPIPRTVNEFLDEPRPAAPSRRP